MPTPNRTCQKQPEAAGVDRISLDEVGRATESGGDGFRRSVEAALIIFKRAMLISAWDPGSRDETVYTSLKTTAAIPHESDAVRVFEGLHA
ncbi:hypothetical protein [Granulicella arctica]|uniref:hypothetical protein n=1 Tax=Granulicella arctica TaxID=940613 RepID=UPI00295B755B|nr:hypothetical protein [Granulicella arctica]